MATFILEAVDPSVDSSGLTRCCRHGAIVWRIRVKLGDSTRNAGSWRELEADHQPACVVEEA